MNDTESADVEQVLDSWLELVLGDDEYPDSSDMARGIALPSNQAADLLSRRIASFDEDTAHRILRHLLVPSGSLGVDRLHADWLRRGGWRAHMTGEQIRDSPIPLATRTFEFGRRLLSYEDDPTNSPPPWEGITWVLDLLPGYPQQAIDVLSGYVLAHAQVLPDGRYAGLIDALSLVRARYIGLPGEDPEQRRGSLLALLPRQFERLIERYFAAQDFETTLTPPTSDGGRDIVARRSTPPPVLHILVECKNWTGTVGRPRVQQLLGVVSGEKASGGMVVATSGFSVPAKSYAHANPRLTLLGGTDLVSELNRVLGADWPRRVDQLLLASEMHAP